MGKVVVKSSPLEVLREAAGPYAPQVRAFVQYLDGVEPDLREGIREYLEELNRKKRTDRSGRKVSYSPAWWNQQMKALKWSVRYLLDHYPTLTIPERWAVEQELKKLKRRAPKVGIAKTDRVPTLEELKTLEEKADPRLSLMIRFLEATSSRVSEMLGAEVGKARRGARITYLEIAGKKGKTRDLRLPTALYDAIRAEFKGAALLFEHSGQSYNRVAVTNRIRELSARTIGKEVTAHLIRHHRGTVLSEKFGISKAASELGHSSIATTKMFYDHSKLTDAEYLQSFGK
ncbi:MAG: tyrosine-type recombinase/integrase [Spirochaetia bacterium]